MLGKVIQNFKIVSELGKGGMGIVYKAYDQKLERYVAIKVLKENVFDNPRFIERFKQEAKNQAKLTHPNIVAVYGFIEVENVLGIVMEYVEGESLDRLIYRQKKLHLYDAMYILKQAIKGLGFAHSKGFIHRDIKPSNIMITESGEVKIMDFGISKSINELQKKTSKAGTTIYMSPEQLSGKNISFQSDIYALGITFYEMLAGWPPFYSKDDDEIIQGHLHQNPPSLKIKRPAIPDVVELFALKALEKDTEKRFKNCKEYFSELDKLDRYLAKVQNDYFVRKEKRKASSKTKGIIFSSLFLIVFLALAYFSFKQVDSFIQTNQTDKYREFTLASIFSKDKNFERLNFVDIKKGVGLRDIHISENYNTLLVGEKGTCFMSTDSGRVWQEVLLDSLQNFNACWVFNSGSAFIVGDSSAFYFRRNVHAEWERLKLKGNYSLFDVDFLNEKIGFIVGSKGLILKTIDGGINWKKININYDDILFDVKIFNSKVIYICGWNGIVLKSVNGGNTFNKVENFTRKYLKSIDFVDENTGIVVGGAGKVFRTNDGGKTWNLISLNVSSGLNKIKFYDNQFAIIIGQKGSFFYSKNFGKEWKKLKSKTFFNLNNAFLSPDGRIFILTDNGKLMII